MPRLRILKCLNTTLKYYKEHRNFYLRDPHRNSWIKISYMKLADYTLTQVGELLDNDLITIDD